MKMPIFWLNLHKNLLKIKRLRYIKRFWPVEDETSLTFWGHVYYFAVQCEVKSDHHYSEFSPNAPPRNQTGPKRGTYVIICLYKKKQYTIKNMKKIMHILWSIYNKLIFFHCCISISLLVMVRQKILARAPPPTLSLV